MTVRVRFHVCDETSGPETDDLGLTQITRLVTFDDYRYPCQVSWVN